MSWTFANCMRPLSYDPIVGCLHDLITLTGAFLEVLAVEDLDDAAPVGDETGLLQSAGDDRDRLTAYAEHLSEELLGNGELVLFRAIVDHEQPSAHPLQNRVEDVAGHNLGRVT